MKVAKSVKGGLFGLFSILMAIIMMMLPISVQAKSWLNTEQENKLVIGLVASFIKETSHSVISVSIAGPFITDHAGTAPVVILAPGTPEGGNNLNYTGLKAPYTIGASYMVTGTHDRAGGRHAIDFGLALVDVVAMTNGTVISYAWDSSGGGNILKINNGDGYCTVFMHLDHSDVSPGQYVQQGQLVARSGNTGNGVYHLHAEIDQMTNGVCNIDSNSTEVPMIFDEIPGRELVYLDWLTSQNAPPQNCYTLSLAANPPSGGSVNASPAPTCNGKYAEGTVVQLTAAPNSGYSFANWSGDAANANNPVSVTMTANRSVTANFLPCYTLTKSASPVAGGTVIGSPAPNCNSGTQYIVGTVVQLTAAYNPGYFFTNWTGDASGTTNPVSMTMNGNKNIVAGFLYNVNIQGHVTLEGRPTPPAASWSVPLEISLTLTGSSQPTYTFNPTTDSSGNFTLTGIAPGTYEIRVKNSRTLRNTKTVTLIGGANPVDFGTLKAGDANNDNTVSLLDFSVLAGSFDQCQGNPGYDARADFNGDTCITLLDFSLLASNYDQVGASLTHVFIP